MSLDEKRKMEETMNGAEAIERDSMPTTRAATTALSQKRSAVGASESNHLIRSFLRFARP